jgi:hypothetical protein
VHLVLTHEGGATSTAHLSLTMPPDATRSGLSFYDHAGWHDRPDVDSDAVEVHTGAVGELVELVRDGRTEHRCDAAFGAEVVRVLDQAQGLLH